LLVSPDLLLDLEELKVVLLELTIVTLELGSPCDELRTLGRGALKLHLKHLDDLPQLLSLNEAFLVPLLICVFIDALLCGCRQSLLISLVVCSCTECVPLWFSEWLQLLIIIRPHQLPLCL
jgi:hypothetical protein